MEPFIGSEAVANGTLTRGQLRWNYRAIHPNVYVAKDQRTTFPDRTVAAWLWTGRTAVVAGRAAAYVHGVHRVTDATPIELIGRHTRRRAGIVMREERLDDDEILGRDAMRVTTPERTAVDLGRQLPRDVAVELLDVLARTACLTGVDLDPLLERHRGTRGISAARVALGLMDAGSQCPEETRMRLLLNDFGLPRPRTDIIVSDGRQFARIGMGWDDVELGVSFLPPDSTGVAAAIQALSRHEMVQRIGWTEVGFASLTQGRRIACRVRDELRRRRRRRPVYSGSRATGQDMHRGPPRPVPSSDAEIGSTSMPESARRMLVSVLRS